MFEFAKETPLSPETSHLFIAMAWDGHHTYVSSDDKQILAFDDQCSCINQIHTYCSYHTFCYASDRDCFYAASKEEPGILLKLSKELDEPEKISIKMEEEKNLDIDILFYDRSNCLLYIAIDKEIYCVDSHGNTDHVTTLNGGVDVLLGIESYGNYFLCLVRIENQTYLSIHRRFDGTLLEKEIISEAPALSMALLDNKQNPLALTLRILGHDGDKGICFRDYHPHVEFLSQYALSLPDDVKKEYTPSELRMQQLCGRRISCPVFPPRYRRSCNCGCNCQNSDSDQFVPPLPDCGPGPVDHFEHSCFPNQCHCCPWQSCSDIIESIALSEASLAHILNAEGEKLQKAIAHSKNISELLKVNESVQKTIIYSTHLEQMLFYKLEAVLQSDCMQHMCSCPPSCPHKN